MNEHNLWAAVVIGGGLSILNVMVASAHLDQLRRVRQLERGAMEKRMKKVKTRRKERKERKEEKLRDAIAIDIDSLIDETSEKTSKVSCKSKECEIDKGVSSKKKPHKSGTQKKKEVLDNDEEVDKDGRGGSARKGRRQKRCKKGEKQCKRNKKRKQEKKAQHKKGIGVAEEAVVLQM